MPLTLCVYGQDRYEPSLPLNSNDREGHYSDVDVKDERAALYATAFAYCHEHTARSNGEIVLRNRIESTFVLP